MPSSLTRGVYLDLHPILETAECLGSLRKFFARRGRQERIYSDNGRTFVGAAEWMKAVMKDERLQTYLSTNQIKWQFNVPKSCPVVGRSVRKNDCPFEDSSKQDNRKWTVTLGRATGSAFGRRDQP